MKGKVILFSALLAGIAGAGERPIRAVQLDLARQMDTVPFIEAFTRKVANSAGTDPLKCMPAWVLCEADKLPHVSQPLTYVR